MRERQAALLKIRRDVEPRVLVELDQVEAQIAAVLDARQQDKWHKMFGDLRAAWLPPEEEAVGSGQ